MLRNALLICLVALASTNCARAIDNDMPKDAAAAFANATEIELYSLDPAPGFKGADSFHGYKVLGKTVVKGDQVKKLWTAVEKGRQDSDGIVAACFQPRHGLRVVTDKNTFDIVVCYECLSATVYSGDTRIGSFLTTRSPEQGLTKILADAGVALPKKGE